jgi:hypothetical protein
MPQPQAALHFVATPEIVDNPREDEESGSILDASLCAKQCSHHGDCVMGNCVCKNGYAGTDCSEELPSRYEEDGLDNLDLLEIRIDSQLITQPMAALWE